MANSETVFYRHSSTVPCVNTQWHGKRAQELCKYRPDKILVWSRERGTDPTSNQGTTAGNDRFCEMEGQFSLCDLQLSSPMLWWKSHTSKNICATQIGLDGSKNQKEDTKLGE